MQNMSDEGLEAYSHHLTKIMRFSAVVLGRALGLTVVQPFLHPQIVAFSIGLPKVRFYFDYALDVRSNRVNVQSLKVGLDPEGNQCGKLVLREIYPGIVSQWRRKDPIEVGSGSFHLTKHYEETQPRWREESSAASLGNLEIRDAEHWAYYKSGLKRERQKTIC
jgi:asparagine synthase (glutamine-hydrolysing)